MKGRIGQAILTAAALAAFAIPSPHALAQNNTVKGQKTVGGQMKEGTKEMGKAGKSLGGNFKRGHVVRGSKHFGKHVYHGSKHIAKGSVKAAKKTGKTVKKTVD